MTQHVVPESMNCSKATLADVLRSLDGAPGHLDETKVRDLRSSVFRIAKMLGDTPEHIALDLPAIAKNLEKVNPMALGMTWKTFSNIKSNFLLAVRISDL